MIHRLDAIFRDGRQFATRTRRSFQFLLAAFVFVGASGSASAQFERTERFDRDPGWEGRNNRSAAPRNIKQDFGWSDTAHAGGQRGEIGGFITPAAEPAFYAK